VNINDFFDNWLQSKLEEKKSLGTLRTLVHPSAKVDFCSNDYFGFAQSGKLILKESNHLPTGSTDSRSISGNSILAESTEEIIAHFHKREAGLIFNTGYMANIGLFSCLACKGDTYISDEYIHASIIDGMRLNPANRLRFKHNNLSDLEKKLQVAIGRKIVVIESIYSMDGDEAPIIDIAYLCHKHKALLIVDEAHATAVFGDNGEGLVVKYGMEKEVYACIHTFGKALGLHGAIVIGSQTLRNFLINHARSFIFTTALPAHIYLQIQKAYSLIPQADRKKLNRLILFFRNSISKMDNIQYLESRSPIQGIIIGNNFKTKELAVYLSEKGYFVRPILSPSVPPGSERIRICLHSFNSERQISALLNEVNVFFSTSFLQ
jgi:8-amino-7-oxononanoate synthase